ncbi:hypothetical protein TSUD_225050 [Trifolium subterraneum]|uniref:Histone-lysine N-methyltransferase CLF n=1 Tax=Trifolium subterraneum TaxID=3900 RepID=A0A2Z6M0S9_TRISU|nr:hypothetical protein TSUD_225050 [Trifolium subterraneum]
MASKSPPPPSPSSSSRSNPLLDSSTKKLEDANPAVQDVLSVIESLKKQVAAKRVVTVKNRVEENRQKLIGITNQLWNSSEERRTCGIADGGNRSLDLLSKRQKEAIDTLNGVCDEDRDSNGDDGDDHGSTAVLLGSNVAVKNAVRPIKLPEVKRLPPYTTWIFLDRFVLP